MDMKKSANTFRKIRAGVPEMTKKFSKEYKLSSNHKQAVSKVASLLKQMDAYSKKLLSEY